MTGLSNNVLYTVNRSTGIATRVGGAIGFGVGELRPSALAWDGTNLYMTGLSNDALYTVDRTTGVATRVGRATITPPIGMSGLSFSALNADPASIASDITRDTLWVLDQEDNSCLLYTSDAADE